MLRAVRRGGGGKRPALVMVPCKPLNPCTELICLMGGCEVDLGGYAFVGVSRCLASSFGCVSGGSPLSFENNVSEVFCDRVSSRLGILPRGHCFPSPSSLNGPVRLVGGFNGLSVMFNNINVGNRCTFGRPPCNSRRYAGRRFLGETAEILRISERAEAVGSFVGYTKSLSNVPGCYVAIKVGRVFVTEGMEVYVPHS